MNKTNVDHLIEEGLLDGNITAEQKDIINELSDQEIRTVLKAGKKLLKAGGAGAPQVRVIF